MATPITAVNHHYLLRTVTVFTDDPDWALTQDDAAMRAAGTSVVVPAPPKGGIVLVGRFLDVSGAVITGSRGSFGMTPMVVWHYGTVDGTPLVGCIGMRRYVLDDVQSGELGVRLTAFGPPAGTVSFELYAEALARR